MLRTASVSRKAASVPLFAALVYFTAWSVPVWGVPVWGQDAGGFGGVQSLGIAASYSPDSSHMLIGESEQRRLWSAGIEYTRLLRQGSRLRLDYEGSVQPFYLESDPTLTSTVFTYGGHTFVTPGQPVRVVSVERGPVGSVPLGAGPSIPFYALYGRQNTYAAVLAPLGARIGVLPRRRVQPSFAINLGLVFSARDIPVDDAERFNFMFEFGPGVQVYSSARSSLRLEYLYHHVSNAHLGNQNPGVDQGVFRVTFSRHR